VAAREKKGMYWSVHRRVHPRLLGVSPRTHTTNTGQVHAHGGHTKPTLRKEGIRRSFACFVFHCPSPRAMFFSPGFPPLYLSCPRRFLFPRPYSPLLLLSPRRKKKKREGPGGNRKGGRKRERWAKRKESLVTIAAPMKLGQTPCIERPESPAQRRCTSEHGKGNLLVSLRFYLEPEDANGIKSMMMP